MRAILSFTYDANRSKYGSKRLSMRGGAPPWTPAADGHAVECGGIDGRALGVSPETIARCEHPDASPETLDG
eukprot:7387310-Prymnesium_polylepis.1